MKKVLLALGAVSILAVGGLWGFIHVAGRDVPPPDDSDFDLSRPEVAPEDNAYTYFLQATNLLVESTNQALLIRYGAGLPVDEGEVRDLVEQNADCLALVKRGGECAICQTPPVETIGAQTPYVNSWLHMSRVLGVRAQLARREGRQAEAVDDTIAGMRFGDLVQKDAVCLITYLVGAAIFFTSAEPAMEAAKDPAVSPDRLERLAAALEEAGPFDGGLARAFRAEYRMQSGIVDEWRRQQEQLALSRCDEPGAGQRLVSRLRNSNYFFKPNQTKREMGDTLRRLIGNLSLTYADRIRTSSEEEEVGRWSLLLPNATGRMLIRIMRPATEKLQELTCKFDGMLAGARLVVACHRFEREKGRFPETLQELVPQYLAEVPRDPFDGAPFRYSKEKGLAWSVGKNLTDEDGSMRVPGSDKEYAASRDRILAEDFVFELRTAAPTTE